MSASMLSPGRRRIWLQGAADFFFFQNRGYPRTSALEWVGNRYGLEQEERHLLRRGVFSQEAALQRRSGRERGSGWRDGLLVVDGHNVHITVESAILGRPLLVGNDGVMRDLAGQSSRFRFTEISRMALDLICRSLQMDGPARVLFLFDAPMSHSGFLASRYRQRMREAGLAGTARAVPVPENEIPYRECVVASSDRAVLDASVKWLDLARRVVDFAEVAEPLVDFSPFTWALSSIQSPFHPMY